MLATFVFWYYKLFFLFAKIAWYELWYYHQQSSIKYKSFRNSNYVELAQLCKLNRSWVCVKSLIICNTYRLTYFLWIPLCEKFYEKMSFSMSHIKWVMVTRSSCCKKSYFRCDRQGVLLWQPVKLSFELFYYCRDKFIWC